MKSIAVFLLIATTGLIWAQSAPQHGPQRIQITTRLVAQFSQMENQWFEAVQQKKSADLDLLLDENFQIWTPMMAGPTPREAWQSYAYARTLASFKIRQMAVRSINDDNAVVSFLANEGVQSADKPAAEEYFVVDLWSKKTGRWLCTDRYVSPVAGAAIQSTGDRKPTGKQ